MSLLILIFITLISFIFINLFSGRFSESDSFLKSPVIEFIFIYIFVCLSYFLFISRYMKPLFSIKKITILIFLAGLATRIMMIFSEPIMEDDYYRYMWDGAVLANGHNPYRYAPDEFKKVNFKGDIPEDLFILAEKNSDILYNINHPHLKTTYPPVAELTFALAYLIKPFSLISWKAVLLIFDTFTFVLLFLLLKKLKLPESNIIIYWLNPLLIKEIFNSAHMDVIIFPFVLICLLMFFGRRYKSSLFSLSLAVGSKLWPVLLISLLLRRFFDYRVLAIKYLCYFTVLCLVILIPLIITFFDKSSGIETYARSWQNNDLLFSIVLSLSELFLSTMSYHPGHGQLISRTVIILIIMMILVTMVIKKEKNDTDIIRRILIVLSVVFFLSPVQFPWYYLWLLPFLAIIPYSPLLLLTVLMPVYYLRYYFEPRGEFEYYDNLIVCVEYIPVLGWLTYDLIRNEKLRFYRLRSSES